MHSYPAEFSPLVYKTHTSSWLAATAPFAFADWSESVFCGRAEQRSCVCQQGLIVVDVSYQVDLYILKNTLNDKVWK